MKGGYNNFLQGYSKCLDLNFDGAQKSLSPLEQLYLNGKVDTQVYNFWEMLQQPDRKYVIEDMYKKVKFMFGNNI